MCMHNSIYEYNHFCCCCVCDFKLTSLNHTVNKWVHARKMLIDLIPAIISYLQYFCLGVDPMKFPSSVLTCPLALALFKHTFLVEAI